MDYIEKYKSSHIKGFYDDTDGKIREDFYKQARMDVGRAIIRGDIKEYGDDIHSIIEATKRKRITQADKDYMINSPKTKEEVAIEVGCSVFYVAQVRKEAGV
jgi:heterodisulfide reductase subunit A-like polyferredoxin|tara:strand:- start:360 stop:665 length:306 start_codon:yes stop_codon:yes gene_type:complete